MKLSDEEKLFVENNYHKLTVEALSAKLKVSTRLVVEHCIAKNLLFTKQKPVSKSKWTAPKAVDSNNNKQSIINREQNSTTTNLPSPFQIWRQQS